MDFRKVPRIGAPAAFGRKRLDSFLAPKRIICLLCRIGNAPHPETISGDMLAMDRAEADVSSPHERATVSSPQAPSGAGTEV